MIDRIIYLTTDPNESSNVGAYLRAGDDGDPISSTLISGKESLDVHPVGDGDSGIFAEDSGHVTAAKGQFILAVRNDTSAVLTSTDLDYSPIAVDSAGRIKLASATFTSNYEYAEDSASASGNVGAFVLAVRNDVQGTLAGTDGDYAALQLDALGRLRTITDLDLTGDLAGDDDVDTEDPLKVGTRTVTGALGSVSAAGDKANMISDIWRRLYVNDTPNIGLSTAAPAGIDNTVGGVDLFPAVLAGRRNAYVQNRENGKDLFIGATGVTIATGFEVRRGSTWEIPLGPNIALFGITSSAVAADIRTMQIA